MRFQTVAVPALLVVASLGALAVTLEIALRLTGAQPDLFYQLDEQVGAVHIPGKRGHFKFQGERIPIEINSWGYRDVEWREEKRPGQVRIAVLGDSFIEGFQVLKEDLLTTILEQRLNEECGSQQTFQVMNFGHAGFGTAQELDTFRHRALRFDPDLALLFFYPSNDLFNNSSELAVQLARTFYELDEQGRLRRLPFEVYDPWIKRWARHHLKLFPFLRERVMRAGALRRALSRARLVRGSNNPRGIGSAAAVDLLQSSQYLRELPPPLERAWLLTEALLRELKNEADKAGVWFGLCAIPNREEIQNSGSLDQIREAGTYDYSQSLERIASIGEELRIPVLQLRDAFRDSGVVLDNLYYPSDGHWTPRGHRIAAVTTFDWFRDAACNRNVSPSRLESGRLE